jgi:hypothetical protein
MPSITSESLVAAAIKLRDLNLRQREQLADDVHGSQPQLFYSVLLLQRYGASLVQIEVVLNLLLTLHLAMMATARIWPVVTEEVQERCLKRVVGRARFLEGLTAELQAQAVTDAIAAHPEQPMLAVALGELGEMLAVKDEAEKMLLLAALNLVECIGEVATISAGK